MKERQEKALSCNRASEKNNKLPAGQSIADPIKGGNFMNPFFELLRSDGSITVNKALVHSIGLDEAILYGELISRGIYFYDRGQLTEDGYFFNTINDLRAATGLKRFKQDKAIERLQELGLIQYKVKGMPARRYFKIIYDADLLGHYIIQGKAQMNLIKPQNPVNKDSSQFVGEQQTRSSETNKQDRRKPTGNNTKVNNTNEIREKAAHSENLKEQDPVVREVADYYNQLFKTKTGADYLASKKDCQLLKELLAQYDADKVKQLLDTYFNHADQYVVNAGYSLGLFRNNLNSLLTKCGKGAGRQAGPVDAEQFEREKLAKHVKMYREGSLNLESFTDEELQQIREAAEGEKKGFNEFKAATGQLKTK